MSEKKMTKEELRDHFAGVRREMRKELRRTRAALVLIEAEWKDAIGTRRGHKLGYVLRLLHDKVPMLEGIIRSHRVHRKKPPVEKTHRWTIISTISGPEGLQVDLFGGMLGVGRMENDEYRVYRHDERGQMFHETIHKDREEAADEFLRLRDEIKLGYDFEKKPRRKRQSP